MKKIGILSDTHAYWDDRYATFLEGCDEIWHAGDVGSYEILERLSKIATVRAVWGNCDGQDVRRFTTEIYRFKVEDANVMIKHIGGSPDHYDRSVICWYAAIRTYSRSCTTKNTECCSSIPELPVCRAGSRLGHWSAWRWMAKISGTLRSLR